MRATRRMLSKITKQSRPLAKTPLASSTPRSPGGATSFSSLRSRTRRRTGRALMPQASHRTWVRCCGRLADLEAPRLRPDLEHARLQAGGDVRMLPRHVEVLGQV